MVHAPVAPSLSVNGVPCYFTWHSYVLHLFKVVLQVSVSSRGHHLLVFKSFIVDSFCLACLYISLLIVVVIQEGGFVLGRYGWTTLVQL